MVERFMSKKGMMKTAEALIAIIMSLIFVVLIFSRVPDTGISDKKLNIFPSLEKDIAFRNIVTYENEEQIESYINNSIPDYYTYRIIISAGMPQLPNDLPKSGIFTESLFLAGNLTQYSPKIITLYYWRQ